MSVITFDAYVKYMGIDYETDSRIRSLTFTALVGKDYDSFKRRLQTGGLLSDLTGIVSAYEEVENGIEDEDAEEDARIGTLSYAAENKEYDIEEGFHLAVAIPSDEFSKLENWIRVGHTNVRFFLTTTGIGVDDGPAPDISSDPVWENKDHPIVHISFFRFVFQPDDYELDHIPVYSETYDVFGFVPHYSRLWSKADWEYALPAKYRKEIIKQIVEKFGDPKDKYNQFPLNLEGRCTWTTFDIAIMIGHRIASYQLAHPTEDNTRDFKYRLKDSFEELSNIIEVLHAFYLNHPNNYDRLHDIEKKYSETSWLWVHLHPYTALRKGKTSRDYWEIVPDVISSYSNSYLKKPWMECPALETALADAIIYSDILSFGNGLKFHKKLGWVGNLIRLGISIIAGSLVTVGVNNFWLGIFASIVTFIILMIHKNLSPKKKLIDDMSKLLDEMIYISNYFNTPNVSPEFIKQRLLYTADKGALWTVGAIQLVEHAARRNPQTWWTDYPRD